MMLLIIISFSITLLYALMILLFFVGWTRIPNREGASMGDPVTVSILIPCRNEEKNLPNIFKALAKQDYKSGWWELIWIDDHSNDQSESLIQEYCNTHTNSRYLRLPDEFTGKKGALRYGSSVVENELILITDADSVPCPTWLSAMVTEYQTSQADLLIGPVQLFPSIGPLEKLQRLEFMSLMASSAGACGLGYPIMAHGPNMAISAKLYQSYHDKLDLRFASGDDVFLLQAMKKDHKKISFVKSRQAVVETPPPNTLRGFIEQRKRWASKAKGYQDPMMIITSLLVFLTSASLVYTLIAGALNDGQWANFWLLMLIKTGAELPLMIAAIRFYHFRQGLFWFFPFQLVYFLYIFMVGLASLTGSYDWKGRRVQ